MITGLKDKAEHAEHEAEKWEAQADGYMVNAVSSWVREETRSEMRHEAKVARAEAESWRLKARGYRRLMGECRHASLLVESGEGSLTVTCVDCGKREAVNGPNQELTMGVFAGRKYDEFRSPRPPEEAR
jgi:hypothetical protein